GNFLAHARDSKLDLWRLTSPEPVRLLEESSVWCAFSPDSRQFARAMPDGSLCLYDLPSGQQAKQLGGGPRANGLAFHPKDRQIAISHASGVQIRDLETGSVLAELVQPVQPATNGGGRITWHPDGRTLAVVGSDRGIRIWDVATRKQ